MLRKLHVDDCSRKPKYMFSLSTANYLLKLHKKHSVKAAVHGVKGFHIIRYLSACELVLPPRISVPLQQVHCPLNHNNFYVNYVSGFTLHKAS